MDLRCWMALATRALATIGANLRLPAKGGWLGKGVRTGVYLSRRRHLLPRAPGCNVQFPGGWWQACNERSAPTPPSRELSAAGPLLAKHIPLTTAEVQPFVRAAEWLEDFRSLNALHLHEASGEYRDWGNHTGAW